MHKHGNLHVLASWTYTLLVTAISARHLPARLTAGDPIRPPLTSFINQTELAVLAAATKNGPDVDPEVPDKASGTLWTSDTARKREVANEQLHKRRALGILNTGTCRNPTLHASLEGELDIVTDVLLAAANLDLLNPVWRAFIAPKFRDKPATLLRVKNQATLIYHRLSRQLTTTVSLTCDKSAGLWGIEGDDSSTSGQLLQPLCVHVAWELHDQYV